MARCPGQDQRLGKPNDSSEASCLECGRAVGFSGNEPASKCRGCVRTIMSSKLDPSRAKWCKQADSCLGGSTICDKLIVRMRDVFGRDEKRINHALRVLDYAETIGAAEGGDPLIIRAAAILHDIGIHEAERKYGSAAGKYQEIEGPPIAEPILKDNNMDPDRIEHICRIIANHHSARDIDTLEFRVLWDADWLVNLQEDFAAVEESQRRAMIERVFRTDFGRRLGRELLEPNERKSVGSPS